MKESLKSVPAQLLIAATILFTQSSICFTAKAQNGTNKFTVNEKIVSQEIIQRLEKKHKVKFIPGTYWYDKITGAYGLQGGPCIGIGIAGLEIGGPLQSNASGGNTGVFVNGRELHIRDVEALQTLGPVIRGRYWMDMYGNFGFEKFPVALGNIYHLYRTRFSGRGGSVGYPSPVTGDVGSYTVDGSFMSVSVKKADGTYIEYSRD